ncbi:Signal transduction histidine kinase [Andreprevotia lacus DSM 23236]|jgi:signal transduction histidine kinase|uniref:histidine kinase n=1 Tax=Andreprevotia lacus DSM 23236 TaxID=1121001 RepID=A0A1W1X2F5_9NEIS|nr:ATP-binding protein [Andreprevotia lacus]SMC18085.1 Signal transduction histidine kinase [Andreprevotia lacus DSM 23236]
MSLEDWRPANAGDEVTGEPLQRASWLNRTFNRLLPGSLLARLALVMMLGVLASQALGTWFWAAQLRTRSNEEAREAARYIGYSAASALRFFQSLPANYRPLLIEQLREMGGTRFFVNVNHGPVDIKSVVDAPLAQSVVETLTTTLTQELPRLSTYRIGFAWPDELAVTEDGVTLSDLPDSWVQHTLLVKPRPAPILVIQAELESGDWLYLATLMPNPYFLDQANPLTRDKLALQLATLVAVLLLSLWVVRWLTRPLALLSEAAEAFGQGANPHLPESGSREYLNTAHAFHAMQARINRYLEDRERLFASISHDLRTPITRLKLRTEMLDDEHDRREFHEDLDELEMMVKGALQSVKDTDIHENRTAIRLDTLLNRLSEDAKMGGFEVAVAAAPITVLGKPLALKRAISNLIDNAIKYGQRAEVLLSNRDGETELTIRDYGPGVAEEALPTLFQPYVRLEHGKQTNQGGMGLGLGIARDIIHAHGGELTLANHPQGGLQVTITLPRTASMG